MNLIRKFLVRLFISLRGSTLIEIALYVALVVVVCLTTISALGGKLQSVFQSIVDSL